MATNRRRENLSLEEIFERLDGMEADPSIVIRGSFENEAPKTRKRRPLNLENEALYLENEAPKTLKRRPLNLKNEAPKSRSP